MSDESVIDRSRQREGWPRALDLRALANTEPQAPAMIINDWMPAGYATLLAGHGGAGKSMIAMELAACIASGTPFFDLDVAQRRVLYLSCEDREGVIHWRLRRICDYFGLDMETLAGQLDVLDLVGVDTAVFGRDPAGAMGTDLRVPYGELTKRMRELGTEVLIVDGVADLYAGNENARGEVKRFVNALVSLIPPDTGAVVLVSHVNKASASMGTTSEGYSGSTGWHNAVRARWYLRPETTQRDDEDEATGALMLELQKSNLGRTDQALRFQWDSDHHLFTGEPVGGISEFDRRARDREEQDGIITALRAVYAAGNYCPAATQGKRTAYHVLAAADEFPETLRNTAGRKRFWRHIERLRLNGEVREGEIRRANRHKTPTLESATPSWRGCVDASNSPESITTQPDAVPPASNASNSTGGYGGCARTHEGVTSPADDSGEAEVFEA